ncbi:MAG: hypothetical protein R2746_04605 [Acidimicrobiales bacterium]
MPDQPDLNQPTAEPAAPPRPEARPEERTHHGRTVVDPYVWLRDPDDPATIPHLEAENAWTAHVTAEVSALAEEVFDEIRRRTQETDLSVPVRDGAWWYLTRTEEAVPTPSTAASPTTAPAARRWPTRPPSRWCST